MVFLSISGFYHHTILILDDGTHKTLIMNFTIPFFNFTLKIKTHALSAFYKFCALKSFLDIDHGFEAMVLMDIPQNKEKTDLISLTAYKRPNRKFKQSSYFIKPYILLNPGMSSHRIPLNGVRAIPRVIQWDCFGQFVYLPHHHLHVNESYNAYISWNVCFICLEFLTKL